MRLPTKPGQTPTSTATLPIFLASFIEVAVTSLELWSVRTTSSRRMTLAGEKKCRPMTASGRFTAVAISSMFRAEVLLARIAPCLTMVSSLPNTSFLTAMFSKMASITRSLSARSSSASVPVSRPMRCSTCSIVRRPRLAVFS